jgi:hypothetical protein
VVERGGLENRCGLFGPPRVRIPPPPLIRQSPCLAMPIADRGVGVLHADGPSTNVNERRLRRWFIPPPFPPTASLGAVHDGGVVSQSSHVATSLASAFRRKRRCVQLVARRSLLVDCGHEIRDADSNRSGTRSRRGALPAAQSCSATDVAEIPVRQEEQVSPAAAIGLRSDCSTPNAPVSS